jgi:hypothetical protein
MLYILHPRKAVVENVDKIINCGDPSHGGTFWGCPDCGELKFVPYTCKSRFCPSCGNMYNQKRSFSMSCKLISCIHRHCVFTIPEELRIFFLEDRSLIGCLFHAVRDVILRIMFSKMNKTKNFTPGIVQFEPKTKISKTTSSRSNSFALLSCRFLFLLHYTLFFCFEEFPNIKKRPNLSAWPQKNILLLSMCGFI